jgi:hypothetical protein
MEEAEDVERRVAQIQRTAREENDRSVNYRGKGKGREKV